MEVFVTRSAEKKFGSIVQYIRAKWGNDTAGEFVKKVDDSLALLKRFPLLGKVASADIRVLTCTPQTTIIYRVSLDRILVLSFFDVRQDPKKKLS